MLFLLRSALCIGLVASALPDTGPVDLAAGVVPTGAAALSDLCRADLGRCRAVVAAAMLPGEPAAAPAPARKLLSQPAGRRLSRSPQVL